MTGATASRPAQGDADPAIAARIGALAVASLHAELALYPKPGLVSFRDSGAHRDMDALTFVRSIDALGGAFVALAAAGGDGAPFDALQRLGAAAERRMVDATGGVNTHRGAIFTLGLLAAAAGRVVAAGDFPSDERLRDALAAWRRPLVAQGLDCAAPPSHGRSVAARFGAGGARAEAAAGFPSVFEVGLPALRHALSRTDDAARAALHALFALVACVEDTNVLHRGGRAALGFVAGEAARFLARGSTFVPGWLARAERLHRQCVARRISPGGCADLLAASWFVHRLQTDK